MTDTRDRPPEAPTIVERPASAARSRSEVSGAAVEVPAAPGPVTGLELADVLGVGGMGVVYRARQVDLERPVAYKALADAASEEMRARFLREARLTAGLDHPNIVPVHVLDRDADVPGYAMKLVEGKTLATLIEEATDLAKRGKLGVEHGLPTRLDHFLRVCDALAFAHERGVIHRDIKPANVMVGAFGAVYLMDWGIARPIASHDPAAGSQLAPPRGETGEAITRLGMRIGSAPYMSPEQARGRHDQMDGRSDQYSLGLLLQELVTLKPATTRTSELAAIDHAERGQRLPLDAVDGWPGRVPRELVAIIERATALEPGNRYPTVTALADDVRRFLRGEAVSALPEGVLGRLLRFTSKHRRGTLIAFVGVIAAAALALTWTRYQHANKQLAERARGALQTQVFGEVARQARRIDGELFKLEEALEGLTSAAAWALGGPEPPADVAPLYFTDDFADPARRPRDFTDRTAYRWPVSVEFPVIGLAPGVDRASVLPRLRRLSPLREHIRRMVVAAKVGDEAVLEPGAVTALLASRASPIDYAYIDLPEGVHVVWPGLDALPPGYDVRTASFYQMSDRKRGKRWGAPYVDSTTDSAGDDLVLPCTQGIWSPAGAYLGVAGVEITVTKMVDTIMVVPDRTTVRTSLVDGEGRKVIDSRDANKRFATTGTDEAAALEPFDLVEIATAIRAREEGLREVERHGQPLVVAFVRLDALGPLGWYYVVELDAATLGAR